MNISVFLLRKRICSRSGTEGDSPCSPSSDFIHLCSTLNPKPVCSDFSAIVSKHSTVSKDCVVWMVDATEAVEVGIWCLKYRHSVLGIAVNHRH